MKQQEQVKEWHERFGIPVGVTADIPAEPRITLRHNILQEEVNELYAAMINGDIIKTADGIADCMYVLLGTACECGLHKFMEQVFDEVHRSNMSKLDENGLPVYREDGKVLKSKLFSPPDLTFIL